MLNKTINLYKNAYTGLTKKMWLLSVIMLINRSGTMVLAFMSLYCMHKGYTVKQGGFVVALYGIGSAVGAFAGGKISDTFGFYYTQFCALFFGGVLFIVLGQMSSYQTICIVTFFLSMVNESFRPANATAIAHYSNSATRTQSFSLVRLSINLGFAVGSALGGLLASINYHLLFWVDGFTNITAAIFLLIILPKVTKAQQHKQEVNTTNSTAKIRSPYTDKKFLYFIGFQILFAACFFQLFTTIPVYFKTNLHLTEWQYGIIMGGSGLMIFLFEMVLIFLLEGKKPYLFYMGIGTLLIGASFLVLNIPFASGIFTAALAMFIITTGEMLSMPFMNSFYIARSSQRTRGQYAGIYTMAWSVAQVVGSLGGTAFVDKFGFDKLWYAVAFVSLISATGYFLLQKIKD